MRTITIILALFAFTNIAIAQPAPPTISGNTNYCEGQTINLTASSPAAAPTYTWTGPGISGSYTGATLTIPGATVGMNGVYYATVTSGSQTSAPRSVTITVVVKPNMPYAATDVYNYCQNSSASFLTATGANLLWYTSATGGVGSPVPPMPSTATPGTTQHYVTQTVNGCESDRKLITVNVIAKPKPPQVTDISYCQGAFALPLHATGANIKWFMSSSGGIGTTIAPTPITTYEGVKYYYATQTVNGCESDRAEIKVTVNFTPNALITASSPYVCQHDTMSFGYFGNAGSTSSYNWTLPSGASIVSGAGQGPLVVKFDEAGTQTVLLIVDYKGCKSPVTKYSVKVKQVPVVPVLVKSDACQNEVVNISIGRANQDVDQYNWDFNTGNVIYGSEGGPYGVKWVVPGMYPISLTAVTNGCPSVTVVDTINIHSLPDAHIGDVSESNICAGDSVAFTAERYNAGYLYKWLPANYFGNVTNTGTVYGFVQHSGYVQLQVTSAYGCTATDSVLITANPCCEVFFPNAFTPNGDGKNDFFRPLGQGKQQVKRFSITDRWGQTVYQTTDVSQGWDGRFNGNMQDMGTYFYYINYKCANGKTYENKGEVLLIR